MLRFIPAAVCAASIAAFPLTAGAEGIYRIYGGQPFNVPGTDLRIELTRVTDQRCPSTVLCVWEGMKRTELIVANGSAATQTVILCNSCEDGGRAAEIFGHRLTFQDLWPPINEIEALGRPAVLTDYAVSIFLDGE